MNRLSTKVTYFFLVLSFLFSAGSVIAEEKWVAYNNRFISIQRPENWEVIENDVDFTFVHKLPSKKNVLFSVNLADSIDWTGFEKDFFEPGYKSTTRKLDGISVSQFEGISRKNPNAKWIKIYTKSPKNCLIGFAVPKQAMWKDYAQTFEKMVASFKFK